MNRLTHARLVEMLGQGLGNECRHLAGAEPDGTCVSCWALANDLADILMARALADHDRAVSFDVWAEGHRAGFASGDSGYVAGTNQRLVRSTNPYRDQETP